MEVGGKEQKVPISWSNGIKTSQVPLRAPPPRQNHSKKRRIGASAIEGSHKNQIDYTNPTSNTTIPKTHTNETRQEQEGEQQDTNPWASPKPDICNQQKKKPKKDR